MSKEPAEARIVVQPDGSGKSEILVHDPQTGRDVRTGLKVDGAHVEKEVRGLKQQLERAGNRVTVKEM